MNPEVVQPTLQIPPEAYAAIGMLIAANLPSLISFFKELFKSKTSDAVQTALLVEQIKTLNGTVAELKEDFKKSQKDLNEAFRLIRESNRG